MIKNKKPKFKGFSSVGKLTGPYTLVDFELVKQDLYNSFLTRRGERIMEPEIGSIIWELIMDPLDEITISAIEDDVRRIISSEPRVSLVDLNLIEESYGVTVEVKLNYLNISEDYLYVKFEREIRD